MNIKNRFKLALLLFTLLGSTNSHAVFSLEPSQWVNIAQNVISQIKSVYSAAKTEIIAAKAVITESNTYITAVETAKTAADVYRTVQRLQAHYEVITGNYSFGALLNAANDQSLRRYMPSDYNSTVNAINNSSFPSDMAFLEGAVNAYKTKNALYTTANLFVNPSSFAAQRYSDQYANNMTMSALAHTALSQTDQRFTDIEGLINKIDTSNDPKAAWDLGNRITAHNSILANEQIRLQALAIRQKSLDNERLLKERADSIRVASAPLVMDW
jgi:type IV secretion system protein VirB5